MDGVIRVLEWLYLAAMIFVVILVLFVVVATPIWLLTNYTVETLTSVGGFFLMVGLIFVGQRLDWGKVGRKFVGTKSSKTNLLDREV